MKAILQDALYLKILVDGHRLVYFTDNTTTYDICHRLYSKNKRLVSLIYDIFLLELTLGCRHGNLCHRKKS